MPTWVKMVFVDLGFAAFGFVFAWVACSFTVQRLRRQVRRANETTRTAEDHLINMEKSRDEWRKLAHDVMEQNRDLRRARRASPWSVN